MGSFCEKVFTFAQVYLFLTFFCIADARNSPTFQTTAYWFKIQMTSAAECHIVEIPRTQHHWPAFPHNTRPCPPPPPCMSTLTSHHPSLEATLQPQSTVSIVYLKVLCTWTFCVLHSLVYFKALYTCILSVLYNSVSVRVGDVIGCKN